MRYKNMGKWQMGAYSFNEIRLILIAKPSNEWW